MRSTKVHYKMYKAGKGWIFAALVSAILIGGGTYISSNQVVHAASTVTYVQKQINHHWYLLDNSGHYLKGFQYIANQHKTVYYNNQGQMLYGQQQINGHWYLFDN
ncbi:MAG: KxYKxGKxW signal peptide domain-containing protein, partial [Liquorilactobacillus nagelii]